MASRRRSDDVRVLRFFPRQSRHKLFVGMPTLVLALLTLGGVGIAQDAACNDEGSVDYINEFGGTWGSDGAQFTEELNQGTSLICYQEGLEDQIGDSAYSGTLGDQWVVVIDSKYYGDGFKLMVFILHEMKHRQLHPWEEPEDPVANACEEAEADCAAVEGIAAAAEAAAQTPQGIPPGFCEGLLEFRNHFIQAWEMCNGAWFPGFPVGCPELDELLNEVCL